MILWFCYREYRTLRENLSLVRLRLVVVYEVYCNRKYRTLRENLVSNVFFLVYC
jgi:hypothetical protein